MSLTLHDTGRHIATADWKIHYEEAGTGHPVILLHGSGPGATGWNNFSHNIEPLARRFRVLAPDMPGWGASDECTPDRLDHVDAALQFMNALGIDRAAFVGNSMGGATALRLAAEYPDRVSHLITMGAPANLGPKLFAPGGGPGEGLKALIGAYLSPTAEAFRNLVAIMVFDASYATPELCRARADAATQNTTHLTNFLASLPLGGPVRKFVAVDDLPRITSPTLLIHGRDDRTVHFEHSLALLAGIPDSRLVLINRCGHWAMIEHADEFNRLVGDFIGQSTSAD